MASLKGLIRCCRLPMQATFKLVHLTIYLMLHAVLFFGTKFNFVQFKTAHQLIFDHLWYYYPMLVAETLFIGLAVVSYYRCFLTGPGFVDQYSRKTSGPIRQPDAHNLQLTTEDNSEFLRDDEEATAHPGHEQPCVQWEYCFNCQLYKRWYSHHCIVCQRCVLRMDHHCPWVLGCVGYLNYRFFLLFSFWGALWGTYISVFTFFNMHYFEMSHYDYLFFISLNMMVVFAWFVFFFYGSLAMKGLTIIEAADRYTQRRQVVDSQSPGLKMMANKHWRDNLEVIFGTRSIPQCFWPTKRPLLDPTAFTD